MSKHTNILKCFRILLPILFIMYMSNILFCSHTHVINGVVIVHSHPFAKDAHTHTPAELETILFLTHFLSTGEVPIWEVPPFIPTIISVLYSAPLYQHLRERYESGIQLRAPPSTLF